MRILYIICNTRIGGAERHLLKIAQTLHEIHPEMQMDCLVTNEIGVQHKAYEAAFDRVYFQGVVDAYDYDIIHSINTFDFMKEYQERYPDANYVSCVWMEIDHPYNRRWREILHGHNRYCAYITENIDNLDALPEPRRLPHLRRQICNGIDLDFWKPADEKKSNQVVWVGSMTERKNVSDLPYLIKENPDIDFVIVANEYRWDGPYYVFAEILELSKTHSNLTLKWNLTSEEIRTLYQESFCYLAMATSEGQSGALIEAMACGCIPVISELPSTQEIMATDYCCGHLIKLSENQRERVDSFARAIKQHGLRSEGKDPQRRVRELFDIRETAEEYAKLYQEVRDSK